jgi:4'-phosphopantetheinyl transferase
MRSEVKVWQTAGAELTFPSDRIDVWRVPLDPPELREQNLEGLLARDEVDRASRFHFEKDRGRYIRGRAALRILLGRYLEMPPAEIRFHYENNGKPEIAFPHDSRALHFNVSHSGGLALIAVGSGNPIGVDIEKVRSRPRLLDIARRFFSAREVQAILGVNEDRRQEAFFACWTRKEAFLKATGVGLSYPLSQFSVSVDPDGAAELCDIKGKGDILNLWFLADVIPGEGFRGALAREGEHCRIAQWVFDPSGACHFNYPSAGR